MVVLLSSVTLPLLVLPIVTSSVATGAPGGDHLAVSVVQLPVASIQIFPSGASQLISAVPLFVSCAFAAAGGPLLRVKL